MDRERWCRIEALFDQAIELADDERDGFLDERCAGDPALRRELAALIDRANTRSSLSDLVDAEARSLMSSAIMGQVGRQIGPFRLVRLLGEGGMGAVYLA